MSGHAAIALGVVLAVAVYLMLSQRAQNVVMGFLLMSNAMNLLVLTATAIPEGAAAPIVLDSPASAYADPLPQAFILTAIVIGLAAAAFLMALSIRTARATGTDALGDRDRSS